MRKSFSATCRLVVRNGQPSNQLLSDCAPEGLPFETNDPALFDAHMDQVHGRKLGQIWIGYESRKAGGKFALGTPSWVRDGAKPWKWRAPKNPKAFEPKPLEPGAEVTWRECVETGRTITDPEYASDLTGQHIPARQRPESEWIERTGQVWSLGWNNAVWVVPYLPARDELAVLVKPRYGGDLEAVQTWARREAARDAA